MRYIILLVLCAWTGIALAIDYHAKDSLLLQLKQTTIAAERINIYRNLADICFETPDEKTSFYRKRHICSTCIEKPKRLAIHRVCSMP